MPEKIYERIVIVTSKEEADHLDMIYGTDELVRCRDCKWADWYTSAEGYHYCHCMETDAWARTEDDYCSYGEREKTDG